MAFQDYSTSPNLNTSIGDSIYIGPNMARDDVRPAIQQLAADGKAFSSYITGLLVMSGVPFYETKTLGEAATPIDNVFFYSDGLGGLVYAKRIEGGSEIIGTAVTGAGLASAAGASAVGAGAGGTVESYLNTFPVEAFIDPTDTNDGPAIMRAIAAASVAGGVVQFDGSKTYTNNISHWVKASNVTIDGQGCTLTGTGRINASGDTLNAGDWSQAVDNFQIKNINFTGGHFGPILKWCRNFKLENLHRDNAAGTFINLLVCQGGRVTDCTASNGTSSQIFGLAFHCQNVTFDQPAITGGAWVYGIQIKGGKNNRVVNGRAENCVIEETWRDRGDAPWRLSNTGTENDPEHGGTYTYPYSWPVGATSHLTAWQAADPRRASKNTSFIDCRCENVTSSGIGKHFVAREAIGTLFENCESDGSTNFSFWGFKEELGSESGFRYVKCKAAGNGSTSPAGFYFAAELQTNLLDGIYLEDCGASGFTGNGFEFEYCRGPSAFNSQANSNGGAGFYYEDCENPDSDSCEGTNNAYGLRVVTTLATVNVLPRIARPNFYSNGTKNIECSLPVILTNPIAGAPSLTTTTATSDNNTQRFKLRGNRTYRIAVEVDYVIPATGSAGSFSAECVARDNAGSAVLIATRTPIAAMNPDALTGITLTASSNEIRLNIGGKASTTVNWRVNRIVTEVLA